MKHLNPSRYVLRDGAAKGGMVSNVLVYLGFRGSLALLKVEWAETEKQKIVILSGSSGTLQMWRKNSNQNFELQHRMTRIT